MQSINKKNISLNMKKFDFDLRDKTPNNIKTIDKIVNNLVWNCFNISHIHIETEDNSKQWKKVIIKFE